MQRGSLLAATAAMAWRTIASMAFAVNGVCVAALRSLRDVLVHVAAQ